MHICIACLSYFFWVHPRPRVYVVSDQKVFVSYASVYTMNEKSVFFFLYI